MEQIAPYKPKHKVRIVTGASLFDGHDASINIMRRIIQSTGVEVIHLGHDRSVEEVVNTAIQEDVNAIALTSYQGGHNEYFKYMYDLLNEKDAGHIKIFGGGGTGGSAVPIFGPTVARALNDTSIGQNVNRTASIIGATLENAGSGYRFPPFVEITDECGIGYGARARTTINDKGEIDSIYIVSSGENYPISDQDPVGVTDVTVVATGIGYNENDTATDNFGNEYSLTIDNGRIVSASPINITEIPDLVTIKVNSETGLGSVLKPILGPIPPQKEIVQVIDCIS